MLATLEKLEGEKRIRERKASDERSALLEVSERASEIVSRAESNDLPIYPDLSDLRIALDRLDKVVADL